MSAPAFHIPGVEMDGHRHQTTIATRFDPFPPGYPHQLIQEETLPDGTRLRIRPIMPADRHRHWRFVCSLSLQSRYHRLMSARNLLPGELRRMVAVDYLREMALVAVVGEGDDEQELGVARYVRDGPEEAPAALVQGSGSGAGSGAEFAIVVADAWQRRGVGKLLLRSLVNAAAAAGVVQLGGITLATNVRMIRLARRLGFQVSGEPHDWTVKRITWRQSTGRASLSEGARAPGHRGAASAALATRVTAQ
jgi:acetyltransferase